MEISENSDRNISSNGGAGSQGEKFNGAVQCCTMKSIFYHSVIFFLNHVKAETLK